MAGEFMYNSAANTPPKYLFTLLNPDTNELIKLVNPPIEWEEGITQVERDIKVGGIFTSFIVESLTFVQEGANFLRKIWDEKEFNGKCDLIISRFVFNIHDYVEMPTRYGLNFATAKPRVMNGNQSIGFLIEATKSSLLVKFENRKDKKVDITKRKSIGGYEIVGYQDIPINIGFDPVNAKFYTKWIADYRGERGFITNHRDHHIFTEFDMQFNSSDFSEAQEVDYETQILNRSLVKDFFSASEEDREIEFRYAFNIEVTNRKGRIFDAQNTYAVLFEIREGATVVSSERLADVGKKKGMFTFSDLRNIELKAGQSMRIYIQTDDTGGIDAYIRYSKFEITEKIVQYAGRTLEGVPIYECFERSLQHITDSQYPFYSDFFGRTDVEYNANGDKYPTESQKRFASVLSGLNLRGAKLFDVNNPLSFDFEDLFDSGNALWNLGYENVIIDGTSRIRIEDYGFFFEDVEALDLSDRITKYDIETEAMPELAYAQVVSGFDDYSYERINGRGEFNTKSSRTTVINTDTEYENISFLRADTMGITEKIAQDLTTEDTEEDNSLFILKTQRSGGSNWVPEQEENISILNGSSLFGVDTFNLYFTPVRMLLRHGNRIKGAFLKFLSTYLRFQHSNKLQTLETSGEGYDLIENQDILIDDLANPIYKPIKHTVTTQFSFGDFDELMLNPKGYITFSPEIKGYLLSLKKKNNEDKATIEIIEKI